MAINISGANTQINIIASFTFPLGFNITEFPDDVDPLEIPAIQIGNAEMGVNGDLVIWSRAAVIPVELSVIPTSDADTNLSILLAQNSPGAGKLSLPDTIQMTISYPATDLNPNGFFTILTGGKLISGPPALAIASSGRIKTRTYAFSFEKVAYS